MVRGVATLIFGLLMAGCAQDDNFFDPVISEGNVNLSSPEVGQKSMYLRYTSSCNPLSGDFNFTGDSLILEVFKENSQLHLRESMTENSPLVLQGFFQGAVQYPVTPENVRLLLPDRTSSALFFFYGNDTIHLKQQPDVFLKQNACRLALGGFPFVGNEIGFVGSFRVGPVKLFDKMVVSCIPIILDLEGYLIYDNEHLFISHQVIDDGAEGQVSGWTLLDYNFNEN